MAGHRTFLTFLFASFACILAACAEQNVVQNDPPADDGPKVCGGIAGVGCGEGEYCKMAVGDCLVPDMQGQCVTVNQMCTRDYRPVCGCDGKTYGNACTAGAASMNIASNGECSTDQG